MKNEIEFRAEWADTDPAAIAFYPNFFKWFDLGTWHLLFDAGLSLELLKKEFDLFGCPVVDVQANFQRPVLFWDMVSLTSCVRRWGRKSFEVAHAVQVNGQVCALGREIRVCARRTGEDPDRIEAVPIPEALKARLPAAEL